MMGRTERPGQKDIELSMSQDGKIINERELKEKEKKERRENLKKKIMDQLWNLGEEQIEHGNELHSLASDAFFSREVFEEEQSPAIHEADEKDNLVAWLNGVVDEERGRLSENPGRVEQAKIRLFEIVDSLADLGRQSAGISEEIWLNRLMKPSTDVLEISKKRGLTLISSGDGKDKSRVPLGDPPHDADIERNLKWIIAWREKSRQYVIDLYALAVPQIEQKKSTQTAFQAKRIKADEARVRARYESSSDLLFTMNNYRVQMVLYILKNNGFSREEWSKYLRTR